MFGVEVKFDKHDLQEILETLSDMPRKIRRNVIGPALKAAAQPVVRSASDFARGMNRSGPGSGLLSKSIDVVLRYYLRGDGGNILAVVGASNQVIGDRFGRKHRPSKIAHLVERGHVIRGRSSIVTKTDGKKIKIKGTGKILGKSPAYPFLEPAWKANDARMHAIMADEASRRIDQLASKGAAKLAAVEE